MRRRFIWFSNSRLRIKYYKCRRGATPYRQASTLAKQTKNKSKYLHNDVVNGNVDELHEETDEAHDSESDGSGKGNLLELCKECQVLT